MGVYLRAKFEVSSIILTSFKQGGNFTPPLPQNEPLKSPPRLELITANLVQSKTWQSESETWISMISLMADFFYLFVASFAAKLSKCLFSVDSWELPFNSMQFRGCLEFFVFLNILSFLYFSWTDGMQSVCSLLSSSVSLVV